MSSCERWLRYWRTVGSSKASTLSSCRRTPGSPVTSGEVRLTLEDGVYISDGQRLQKAFGVEDLRRRWPMLNLTSGRGSINTACIHYIQHQGLLVTVNWDFFHGMWNAIKHTARSVASGRTWRAMLEFLVCCNMNHGAFRSGQWFRAKQEWLEQYMATHDHTSPDFLLAAGGIAADFKLEANTIDQQRMVFERLGHMRSFHEKGPVLKLQRWLGIQEAWSWYEGELHASRRW